MKHATNLPKPFMTQFPVGTPRCIRWKGTIPGPEGWQPLAVLRGAGQGPGSTPGSGDHPSGTRRPSARSWAWGHPGRHVPPAPVAMAVRRRPVMAAAWSWGQPWCGVSVTESRFPSLPRAPSLLSTTWPAPQLPYSSSPCLPPLPPPPCPCPGLQPLSPLPSLLFTQLH